MRLRIDIEGAIAYASTPDGERFEVPAALIRRRFASGRPPPSSIFEAAIVNGVLEIGDRLE